MKFVKPSQPVERPEPPAGDEWLHEVKFDGFRLQIHHVKGRDPVLYGKSGSRFVRQFDEIAEAVRSLPCLEAVIDAEAVACGENGLPDFYALLRRQRHGQCAWCFDLLALDGTDLRDRPLLERRKHLARLLRKARNPSLRFSEASDNALELLEQCAKLGLEGIVSKKAQQPYRSGRNVAWIKTKCEAWRKANADRWRLFAKAGAARGSRPPGR